MQAPIVNVKNSFVSMMANAMSVTSVMPNTPAFFTRKGPLSFSSENETILKALCPFICELDDEREEFNLGHWRCFFKCVRLDGNGTVLNVKPLPEKFKLRPGSRVRIHTKGGFFDGMVKEFGKHGITKLYMKEKFIDGPHVIKGIDVERYN